MVQQTVVGGTLNVGFTAKGVDATTGYTDVAEEQLDHGHAADVLYANGVLGPTHGVHDGTGLVRTSGGREGFVQVNQLILAHTGHG